jgi:hypothetical protein
VHHEGRRELRNDLAASYMHPGVAPDELGLPAEALADYGTCISLREELVRREARRELRHDLAGAYMNRGFVLRQPGRRAKALADFGTCVGLCEKLVRGEGPRELEGDVAWGYANKAELLPDMEQRQAACRLARKAVPILQSEVARTGRADLRRVQARRRHCPERLRLVCGPDLQATASRRGPGHSWSGLAAPTLY